LQNADKFLAFSCSPQVNHYPENGVICIFPHVNVSVAYVCIQMGQNGMQLVLGDVLRLLKWKVNKILFCF
jgi:hypothetical protein